MELVKQVIIGEEKINYNVSALVVSKYAALFQKDIFKLFSDVLPYTKLKEDEQTEYLLNNSSIMTDLLELAFTSISMANPEKYEDFDDFLSRYLFFDLIKASGKILSNIYNNNKPINNTRTSSSNKKK